MRKYTKRGISPAERIKDSILINKDTDCWEWQKTRSKWGYGYLRISGKMRTAHRVSYETFVSTIPDGLTIDHLCKNPRCVNPAHLEAVSLKENLRRGSSFSANNARKTHCDNGHQLTGENLYVRPDGNRQCRRCNLAAVLRYRTRRSAA